MTRTKVCPTVEQWQRYLLDPEALEQRDHKQHLEACRYCRFLLDQLKRELEELEQVWNQVAPVGVIHLKPFAMDVSSEEPATVLLAAKGNDETDDTVAVTLSSPDQKVLLRAIRDPHSKEIWLYLMADDPALCRNVLVKPFGSEHDVLTDQDGRINLGDVEWPKPEAMTAEVRLPKATFKLSRAKDLADKGASAILDSSGGDRIKVSFTGEGRNRRLTVQLLTIADTVKEVPLKVAIRRADTELIPRIQSITLKEVSFDNVDAEGTLEIYLFQ